MKSKLLGATCSRFAMLLVACMSFVGLQSALGHGVQVGYGTTPTGFIRVYIEHWHGNLSPSNLGSRDNINVTVTDSAGSNTFNVNVSGTVNNTSVGSLPGLVNGITILEGCPNRANRYNDWGYWDFAPGSCDEPITVKISRGNSVIFTESCSQLYPQSIVGQVFSDQAPPVITASDINVASTDCVSADVADFGFSVQDACDANPTVTVSHNPGAFPVGTTAVTVTATDDKGFTSTATFNVIVTTNDTTPPTIVGVGSDTTVECGSDLPDPADVSVTDSCDPNPTLTFTETVEAGNCPIVSIITRTWTATDSSGNQSTATQVITVVDTTAPEILTTAVDILPSDAPITFTVTATDACSVVDLVLTYDCTAVNGSGKTKSKLESCVVEIVGNEVTILDSGGVGTTITILANATDACGNSSSADIAVTVLRPANEGVGNGVDGNTPGHDNNGGNDDPEFGPGNPGAKGKNK